MLGCNIAKTHFLNPNFIIIVARRSSCGALIQQNNEQTINKPDYEDVESSSYEDPNLSVSPSDITSIESTYKGHKTKVFVCQSLANLYTCPKISTMSNSVSNWVLTFTGVPVLLLDLGTTRSRTKRYIEFDFIKRKNTTKNHNTYNNI